MYACCVREFSKKNCRVSRQGRVWQPTDCPSNNTKQIKNSESNHVQEYYYEYQQVKDRANRMQSESSLLALLRCSRFSRRSLKQHCQLRFRLLTVQN